MSARGLRGWDGVMMVRPDVSEVVVMSNNTDRMPQWPSAEHVPVEELVRRQGTVPITSVAEMAVPGLFESDEELDEFLADLYASRRAGMA